MAKGRIIVSDGSKHLSPDELAKREDVPLQTVYGWNKNRTGPRYMKIGRHVRYRLADVIAWEESRYVGGRTA
jgi:predicted DNA-binding transcriptional regulator AlpA